MDQDPQGEVSRQSLKLNELMSLMEMFHVTHLKVNDIEITMDASGFYKNQLADVKKTVNTSDEDILFHSAI